MHIYIYMCIYLKFWRPQICTQKDGGCFGCFRLEGTNLHHLVMMVTVLLGRGGQPNLYSFVISSIHVYIYMGVSVNGGTPKSSILIGISIRNHPFWRVLYCWKHIYIYIHVYIYIDIFAYNCYTPKRSTFIRFVVAFIDALIVLFVEAQMS